MLIGRDIVKSGHRTFTCPRELGHHCQGDGVRIDELVEQWERRSNEIIGGMRPADRNSLDAVEDLVGLGRRPLGQRCLRASNKTIIGTESESR